MLCELCELKIMKRAFLLVHSGHVMERWYCERCFLEYMSGTIFAYPFVDIKREHLVSINGYATCKVIINATYERMAVA